MCVSTAISIRCYNFIVNNSFLFLDFKTSIIVLNVVLPSFLNIANLFLKYVFYMRQLIFEYVISLLIFYCWITFINFA